MLHNPVLVSFEVAVRVVAAAAAAASSKGKPVDRADALYYI